MHQHFLNIDRSWTLFLDRDGVINERIMNGYVRSYKEFKFLNGVPEAIYQANKLFGKTIIVTNQQGIGKGLMKTKDLEIIHNNMMNTLDSFGAHIDMIQFCPDLKSKENNCRKPSPQMALNAQAKFPDIDFRKSIMVGDTESDLKFGQNCGMHTALIGDTKTPLNTLPTLGFFKSLKEFIIKIDKLA